MKTLKSVVAVIVLLIVCATTNAAVKPGDKLTREEVINIYVDAIAHGKTADLSKVLDDGLQFNVKRGDNESTITKSQLLASLKDSSADPSVTTTTTALEQDDQSSTVKIDFKFDGFTRSDVVTLANTGDWVITNVVSSTK